MKKLIMILTACAVWSASWAVEQKRYAVEAAEPGAECLGWGVSLEEWAEKAGALEDWFIADFADKVVGNMGAQAFRYVFPGNTDDSYHGAESLPFMDADGTFHWERDAARQRLMQRLNERCLDGKFMAVSAVPENLKVRATDGAMVLAPANYAAYADYVATVLGYFKTQCQLEFSSIDPGCQDAEFLRIMAEKLKSAELGTVLVVSNNADVAIGQRPTGSAHPDDLAAVQALMGAVRSGATLWLAPEVPGTYVADGEFRPSGLFYFYSQIMSAVLPGSKYVKALSDNALASLNADGTSLTLLLLNAGDSPVREWITLNGVTAAAEQATATRTSATERCASVEAPVVNGGYMVAELPAQSLTTVVLPVKPTAEPMPQTENLLSFGTRDAVVRSRADKSAELDIALNALAPAEVTLTLEGEDARYFSVSSTGVSAPGTLRVNYSPEARGCHHAWITASATDGSAQAVRLDLHGDAYDVPRLSLKGNTTFASGSTDPVTSTLSLKGTALTGQITADVDGADSECFTTTFPWAVKEYTQIVFDNSRTGWKHVKAYVFNPDNPIPNLICGCQGRGYPMVDAGNGLFTQQFSFYFDGMKIKFMEDMETTITEAVDFLPGVTYYAAGRCADRFPHVVPLMMDVDDTMDVTYTSAGAESATAVLRLNTAGLDEPFVTNLLAKNAAVTDLAAECNALTVCVNGRNLTVRGVDVSALRLFTLTGVPAASSSGPSLDASALPSGVYLLSATTVSGATTHRRVLLR